MNMAMRNQETEKLSRERTEDLRKLEGYLGVRFKDLSLLHTALVHTSYANEGRHHTKHNERLEFLGDAVLELVSSTYLFQHFPGLPEGELTKTRASIVCSATLAKLARRLHLGDYLLLGHGEEMSGGRTRTTNLEDAFEAVIGAVYLDQGWEAAQAYVLRQLAGEFENVREGENLQDYKTELQELVQQTPGQSVEYEMLEATGPDHAKHFAFAVKIAGEVLGTGEGHSKKQAEQNAARMALEKLKPEEPSAETAKGRKA